MITFTDSEHSTLTGTILWVVGPGLRAGTDIGMHYSVDVSGDWTDTVFPSDIIADHEQTLETCPSCQEMHPDGQVEQCPHNPKKRKRVISMQHEEEGRVQLAPRGETSFNHSVSMHKGSLALWWEVRDERDNVETKMRTFSNAETEVLLTFLYDNRDHIYHAKRTEATDNTERAARLAAFQEKIDSDKDLPPNIRRLF